MKGISFLCVSLAGLSLIAGQMDVNPMDACNLLLKHTCTPLQAFVVSYVISMPAENTQSKKCMVIGNEADCIKDADCAWCKVSETDGQCLTKILNQTGCTDASKQFLDTFQKELMAMDKDVKILPAADVAKCTVNTDKAACDAATSCETCELNKEYNAPIICLPSTYAALKKDEKNMCALINNNSQLVAEGNASTTLTPPATETIPPVNADNSTTPKSAASYAAYTPLSALSLLLAFMVL